VFWISPTQQNLYQQFHNVVLNDNTCKTNKYNMYLSVFMIRDNSRRFRNMMNTLVEDELASIYKWILQRLMMMTDNLARAFTLFQFNAGIQSTQSIKSFNSIIKKALNSASTLCDIEKIINKRHEDKSQYCSLVSFPIEISESETINDNFIEDVLDKPQATLQSLLSNDLLRKENLVILFVDRTHICTCIETITKGIIYSIHTKLDFNIKSFLVLVVLELTPNSSFQVNFVFQSISGFDKPDCNKVDHKYISQRNRYRIAFSTAKVAINVALETNKDAELVQLLKDFITANQKEHNTKETEETKEINSVENNNSNQDQKTSEVIPLQQHLIDQITSLQVTRICDTSCKKRIKAVIEISKRKALNEVTNIVQEADNSETSSKQQCKCLLCKKPGHYQKKCPFVNVTNVTK
ncbi:3126_t:CDS:2, partial [Scutellospora calospora]